jgi:DNA-binding HxlR family transcriptional regulator
MSDRRRSPCPIACTLDIIGDKWTLLVIRDMVLGRSHYKQFLESPEGIATNILADRLVKLVDAGLVEKYPSTVVPGRDAYRLTKKGETLRPILKSIVRWGLKNVDGTYIGLSPR